MMRKSTRLAVLIDADNASAKIVDDLFKEIAKIGEASVRRIYGDFTGDRNKSWTKVLAEYAIQPQLHIANTTGKNASDIALVIDAMDLLHAERLDGFCLVSSDSDFTRLASRIREQGVAVYGFGEKKTPKSFVQACQRFIYTENLSGEEADEDAAADAKEANPSKQPPSKAAPLIRKALQSIEDDDDGWFALGLVGQRLSNMAVDFDPRTYGCAKLSDLAAKAGPFEVKRAEGRTLIRAKATSKKKT